MPGNFSYSTFADVVTMKFLACNFLNSDPAPTPEPGGMKSLFGVIPGTVFIIYKNNHYGLLVINEIHDGSDSFTHQSSVCFRVIYPLSCVY